MAKAYAMIANGTEEVECLAVVDILRRAGVDVTLVSVADRSVVGSHGIRITADKTLGEVELADTDLLFLPGGMKGSHDLAACRAVTDGAKKLLEKGKRVAAVCAAPSVVLGRNGLLVGKKAVCYPGMEDGLIGATYMPQARVVTDGNVTTARGLGCSLELGLELAALLCGKPAADKVKADIQI